MFTIRQIIMTHYPERNYECAGCNLLWSPFHVLAMLEENGHDTTRLA